jgi:hypothetical protein
MSCWNQLDSWAKGAVSVMRKTNPSLRTAEMRCSHLGKASWLRHTKNIFEGTLWRRYFYQSYPLGPLSFPKWPFLVIFALFSAVNTCFRLYPCIESGIGLYYSVGLVLLHII